LRSPVNWRETGCEGGLAIATTPNLIVEPATELRARRAEHRRAARAIGVTMVLAVLAAVCWVTMAALAVIGEISALTAVAVAVGGYLALAAVLWGVTAFAERSP
jgi:hypothetical protein